MAVPARPTGGNGGSFGAHTTKHRFQHNRVSAPIRRTEGMDTSSYWTQPRPPRETFESVFGLWLRAGSLFFDGFDYVFGVMLLIGAPAAMVTIAFETAISSIADGALGSAIAIPLDIAVSSFFMAWLSGPLYYGVALRLQEGSWPGVLRGIKWFVPRWPRMTAVLFLSSLLFTLGFLALVVPGLYLLVKLSLADAAVIYEPDEPAIRRSWDLSGNAPINIFLAMGPFLLASIGFTFGVDDEALRQTPVLAFAVKWSLLLLLAAFPTLVTALLYGWVRADEDAAAVARLE